MKYKSSLELKIYNFTITQTISTSCYIFASPSIQLKLSILHIYTFSPLKRHKYPHKSTLRTFISTSISRMTTYASQAVMISSSSSSSNTQKSSSVSDSYLRCEDEVSVSVLDLLVDMVRKSLISGCGYGIVDECWTMEIGNPTNVRHVTHVTFDNFDGFLGLPDEFQPDVPSKPLSASVSVFGVTTESMQLSFDKRGNSVPTILLMMQQRLYALGGLQVEGIFRITGENGQEDYVRNQLKHGKMPDGVDVHCLAGLIKAWFRELPAGILDSFSPEEVLKSETKEQCSKLVKKLPSIEYALLDWALELMTDVAEMEHFNKMNAYNIAVVFAPNMTQMSDPPTALMHAVQLSNFLKILTEAKLEERKSSILESHSRHDGPGDRSLSCSDKKTNLTAGNETVVKSTNALDLLSTNKTRYCQIDISEERHGYSKSTCSCTGQRQSNYKPNSKRGTMRTVINEKEKHVRINSRTKKLEAWR